MASSREMVVKYMTENIHEPLEIILDKPNSFCFNSYVRGYHAYMNIWNPVEGESLVCKREIENPHDKYAVSIIRNSDVVGHAPLSFSKIFSKFLSLPGCTISSTVTGKRVNRGAGFGLEIPVVYEAKGDNKALCWLEKSINKILLNVENLQRKYKL